MVRSLPCWKCCLVWISSFYCYYQRCHYYHLQINGSFGTVLHQEFRNIPNVLQVDGIAIPEHRSCFGCSITEPGCSSPPKILLIQRNLPRLQCILVSKRWCNALHDLVLEYLHSPRLQACSCSTWMHCKMLRQRMQMSCQKKPGQ